MKDKKSNCIVVYETADYGKFKRLMGNRDVKCVNKIIDSIQKVGYIPNPILTNEKMEVIDGQNRLEACRRLGLPVFYYICEGLTIDDARAMNLGRTNWKPINYVKSYAEQGVKSYQYLMELVECNHEYTIQEIYGISKGIIVQSGWVVKGLEDGSFEMTEEDCFKAQGLLDELKPMLPAVRRMEGQKRVMITALAWCMNVPECDHDRFIKTFLRKYPTMRPVVNAETFLYDVTMAYNNSLKNKGKRIDFDVLFRNR